MPCVRPEPYGQSNRRGLIGFLGRSSGTAPGKRYWPRSEAQGRAHDCSIEVCKGLQESRRGKGKGEGRSLNVGAS